MSGEKREARDVTLKLCAAVAASALLITIAGAGSTLAQEPGGVLHVAHRDSPASMSTLEEVDNLDRRADDGGLQQSSPVRPACAAKHNAVDPARPRDEMVVERGRYRADVLAA